MGSEFSYFSPRIPGADKIEVARDFIITKLENFGLEKWFEPITFRGFFMKNGL